MVKFVGGLGGEVGGGGGGVVVVVAERGTIPQLGMSSNPLPSTLDQLVAPARRDQADAAPVALWLAA